MVFATVAHSAPSLGSQKEEHTLVLMGAEVAVAEPLPPALRGCTDDEVRLTTRATLLRTQLSVLRRHRVGGDQGKLLAGLLSPQSTTELNLLNTQVRLRSPVARAPEGTVSYGSSCGEVG